MAACASLYNWPPNYQLANAGRNGEAYAKSVGATSLADLRALPAAALLKGNAGGISHAVAATFEACITKHWGVLPLALLAPYPHATDAEAVRARLDFERDLRYGWDMWAWASSESTRGKNAVYYYHFAHNPPLPDDSVYAGWGPSHFSELWYTFDHLNQESWAWTRADKRLADHISSYWVNFAGSGTPNGQGLPIWPSFTRDTHQMLYLDDLIHARPVAHMKELQAFDAVYDQARAAPLTPTP